jgi:tetratricopeptide (TPR) repeat protein
MKFLRFAMLAGLLMLVSACDQQTVPPTAVSHTQTPGEAVVSPQATSATTPSITSLVTPSVTQVTTDTMALELEKILTDKIQATPGGANDGLHIEGAHVFRVQGSNQPLWAAHTFGSRSFEPEEKHYIAIYAHPNEKWQEVSRAELGEADYVDPASVTQVQIEPTQVWLQVDAGVGAHGGIFYILRFDGTSLHKEVEFSNATPAAGEVRDVNGDGAPDVVLNESDSYVFCYVCGVRLVNFGVMSWDGTKLARVELKPLATAAPAEARRLNDLAIKQANAGLWKAARENIQKALPLDPQNPTLVWNAALIGVTAGGREEHIKDSSHPVLTMLFYGDYDAAIARIRQHSPEKLFGAESPLILGTPAEGDVETFKKMVTEITTKALAVEPDLAGALFLRGWAEFGLGKDNAAATADIQRAAELYPNEELFRLAAAYITDK